jgi:hypothetical protein
MYGGFRKLESTQVTIIRLIDKQYDSYIQWNYYSAAKMNFGYMTQMKLTSMLNELI